MSYRFIDDRPTEPPECEATDDEDCTECDEPHNCDCECNFCSDKRSEILDAEAEAEQERKQDKDVQIL